MKMIIATLMLTAAVATPAMAQTYNRAHGMTPSHMTQSQSNMGMGTDAYAYSPPVYDSSEVQSPLVAMDPDPNVRHQLYIQSTVTDR